MFFGFVGLLNAVCLWPLGLILSFVGVERLEMPTAEEAGALIANGVIGTVVSDLLWLWAVLLTSPLITTVGISLTVPLAVTSDVVLHGDRFAWQYLLGSAMVLLGFLTVTVHDRLHSLLMNIFCWKGAESGDAPPADAEPSAGRVGAEDGGAASEREQTSDPKAITGVDVVVVVAARSPQ
jgi:hypothetical protein